MWVSSLIICWYSNWEVMASILERTKGVILLEHQLLDFILKSSMTWIKKGLDAEIVSRVCSKVFQKFSKSGLDWFGDLYKEIPLHIWVRYLGAIFADLSKAFGCNVYNLLLAKLHASCILIHLIRVVIFLLIDLKWEKQGV